MAPFFILALIVASIGECMADERIIGGVDAKLGEIPYIVSLRDEAGRHLCAGSIIGDRWILTAAHCFPGSMPAFVIAGTIMRNVTTGTQYKIIKKIDHPEYDPEKFTHDIALMKTEIPIVFCDNTKSIQLGVFPLGCDVSVTVSGWGMTETGRLSRTLKVMTTSTMSNEDCQSQLPDVDIPDHIMCEVRAPGVGFCQGDSGGPHVARGRLHGISSWIRSPCGSVEPDGVTRVAPFLPWITWTKITNFF